MPNLTQEQGPRDPDHATRIANADRARKATKALADLHQAVWEASQYRSVGQIEAFVAETLDSIVTDDA